MISASGIRPGHGQAFGWGLVVSFGVLAYAIGKFFAGGLADFLGGRRNYLGGMLGSIGFTILFALGGSIPLFTLASVGNRFVQSFGWGGMIKITSRWFPHTSYGRVMGFISLSFLFGDALARKFMGYCSTPAAPGSRSSLPARARCSCCL